MKINKKSNMEALRTHEGTIAKRINKESQLRRSIMCGLLWENTFYEDGESITKRIASLIPHVKPEIVSQMAIEARTQMKLRHMPLFIVREMVRHETHKPFVAKTLKEVIQRADELTEFLAIYWKDGREKLASQVKKGLAEAFPKFSAYQLAKYDRPGKVRLRDVMFMVHPKPNDKEQEKTWEQLVDGSLQSPDTWEVALSSGKDKKATWERLIKENALGPLALLRNLRNMEDVSVDGRLIKKALTNMKTERILPFRFVAAARYAPKYENELESAMFRCLSSFKRLEGRTVIIVDNSGSMYSLLSNRSEINRIDAACAVAVMLREICDNVGVIGFGSTAKIIPSRRGFALIDAIKSGPSGGTNTEEAVRIANRENYDRIIIVTDEQSHQEISNPNGAGYVVNISTYENGIGYGKWTHIDGWSENIIGYIQAMEGR